MDIKEALKEYPALVEREKQLRQEAEAERIAHSWGGFSLAMLDRLRDVEIRKGRILCMIRSVRNPRWREVLRLRYLEQLPWNDIMMMTDVSRSEVFRRHRKGLEAAAKQEEKRCRLVAMTMC